MILLQRISVFYDDEKYEIILTFQGSKEVRVYLKHYAQAKELVHAVWAVSDSLTSTFPKKARPLNEVADEFKQGYFSERVCVLLNFDKLC